MSSDELERHYHAMARRKSLTRTQDALRQAQRDLISIGHALTNTEFQDSSNRKPSRRPQ
jgi:hypothetical protein